MGRETVHFGDDRPYGGSSKERGGGFTDGSGNEERNEGGVGPFFRSPVQPQGIGMEMGGNPSTTTRQGEKPGKGNYDRREGGVRLVYPKGAPGGTNDGQSGNTPEGGAFFQVVEMRPPPTNHMQ